MQADQGFICESISLCCPVSVPQTVGGKAFALAKGLVTLTVSPLLPHLPAEVRMKRSDFFAAINLRVCDSYPELLWSQRW